jgi:hypothetical protein
VFNVKAGVPVWSSTSAVTTALILLLGIGVAEAANPTRGNRRLPPRQCVPAGMHQEHTEADGVRYLAGRDETVAINTT